MRIINYFLLFILIVSIFNGCKKGEDDPAISLRTRKARLSGEWTLIAGDYSRLYQSGSSGTSEIIIYSEDSYLSTSTLVSGASVLTSTYTISHSLKINFKRDGTFSYVESKGNSVSLISGTWRFLGKNGDNKNKERIKIEDISITGYPSVFNFIFSDDGTLSFNIIKLKNNKIILGNQFKVGASNGETTLNENYFFEQ